MVSQEMLEEIWASGCLSVWVFPSIPGATPSLKSLHQASQSPFSHCHPSSTMPAAGCALKASLGLGLAACSQPWSWGSCFPGSVWVSYLSVPEMEG